MTNEDEILEDQLRHIMSSKVIIVTGASRGIGLAVVQHLLTHGHRVVIVARTKAALERLASQAPEQVVPLARDLSDLTVGREIVEAAVSRWNGVDGVVVNHGVLDPVRRVGDASAEEWRRAFDINVFSGIGLVCTKRLSCPRSIVLI